MNLLYHLDICLKQCGLLWRDVVSFDNSLGFDELHFHTKEKMNLNKLIYEDATVTNMGPRHITAYSYRMKLNNNRTFNKEVLAKLQQEEARFENLLKQRRSFIPGPSLSEELARLAAMYNVTPVVTLKLSKKEEN